ncbi:hypothetical protein D3P07_08940 [Paenibacillus sp. 1011MAR3C5]|uniref:hypothetical protein n=1 Tax=Paenibacillus sp. 1011MAR3C5 TaxID=1675787 RepID=UPI000E6BE224|nr:hypothetical protein [Paenibacillus sp. 1011MAR3C5]RJE90318.1 hypothetical protein D3P07_08940 [Paenibacillus sp. 1011MAR3C5]
MSWIAAQSYYKVERILTGTEMKAVKEPRQMLLYDGHLQTKRRSFPLDEVHDLSFRPMGEEGGILYVHTGHGVYAYTVPEDPAAFIEIFKQHTEAK